MPRLLLLLLMPRLLRLRYVLLLLLLLRELLLQLLLLLRLLLLQLLQIKLLLLLCPAVLLLDPAMTRCLHNVRRHCDGTAWY